MFAFSKVSDPWSARKQQNLAYILEYATCVQHVSGQSNKVAVRFLAPQLIISTHWCRISTTRLFRQHKKRMKRCSPIAALSPAWYLRMCSSSGPQTTVSSATSPLDNQGLSFQLPCAPMFSTLCIVSLTLSSEQQRH